MSEDEDFLFIRFVLSKGQSETRCSDDLAEAFDQSQVSGLNPTWIPEDECLALKPGKRDVFVMDPFDGDAFAYLSGGGFKCTLVGPRCLLTCLNKGEPVPELPYPMFTAAMKDLVVTSTGFGKEAKRDLQTKVERMGGIYSNNFHDAVTHLVADRVRSQKYDVAVKKEIPVMTFEWVNRVWEKGQAENAHATDPQFSKLKCPALMGITFTVSQMNRKDKELMKKSIESHGGVYSGTMDMETTEILIITKPEGDKFKYARKWKIPCLKSDWVFDSIEKGYCLRTEGYRVENGGHSAKERASTPTKDADETAARMLTEVSMCSTIMLPNETMLQKVNETTMGAAPAAGGGEDAATGSLLGGPQSKTVEQLMAMLDPVRVKGAGAFLDEFNGFGDGGGKFFLSGFSDAQSEQLRRVVESGSGTKMNQLTTSVTHVIVGGKGLQPDHARIIRDLDLSPHVVSLHWLVESLHLCRPVPEADFPAAAAQSSSSKDIDASILKAMGPVPKAGTSAAAAIASAATQKVAPCALDHDDFEDDLMEAYRNTTATEAMIPPAAAVNDVEDKDETVQFKVPNAINIKKQQQSNDVTVTNNDVTNNESSGAVSTQESQVERFLIGKKLALCGFPEKVERDLSDWVDEAGGEIVFSDFQGCLDYLVLPVEGLTGSQPKFKAKETVSALWLEDSLDKGELCEIEYFHRPLVIGAAVNDTTSSGSGGGAGVCGEAVVIGISNYSGRERMYIIKAAESLGMVAQEVFAKRDKKEAKKSTHLVCDEAKGQKYEHGVKWGIPIVSKDWIMACHRDKQLVSEKPFLVGESTAFDENKPMPKPLQMDDKPAAIEEKDDDDDTVAHEDAEAEKTLATEDVEKKENNKPEEEAKDEPVTPVARPVAAVAKSDRVSDVGDSDDIANLDMDKLRPKPLAELNLGESTTPSRWMMASQPSPSQKTPAATGARSTTGVKRKRGEDRDSLPHFLKNIKTPETPYGGADATAKSRKYWKKVYDELDRFKWTEEQKLDYLEHRKRVEKYAREREQAAEDSAREFRDLTHFSVSQEESDRMHQATLELLSQKGVPVLGKDGLSFDDLMEEKCRKLGKTWKNAVVTTTPTSGGGRKPVLNLASSSVWEDNPKFLHDVVLYVSKKCEAARKELHSIVLENGGQIRHHYGPEVTHVVFQSHRKNDPTKEFRQARDDGKQVVAPEWVYWCRDCQEKIDESAFTHTYNPKMALSMSMSASKRTKLNATTTQIHHQEPTVSQTKTLAGNSKRVGGKEETSEEESEAARTAAVAAAAAASPEKRKTRKLRTTAELSKMNVSHEEPVSEGKSLAGNSKRRKSSEEELSVHLAKFDELIDSKADEDEAEASKGDDEKSRKRSSIRMALTSTDVTPDRKVSNDEEAVKSRTQRACDDGGSQIRWVDPQEEEERKKLALQMAKETQAVFTTKGAADGETFDSMELPTNLTEALGEAAAAVSKQPRRFLMSGIGAEEQAQFAEFLAQQPMVELCGSDGNFDPTATHVIAHRMSRSEKMLGSIAKGMWVLHHSYMKACLKAGQILPEAEFEWGNPDNDFVEKIGNELEQRLAKAAFRWRVNKGRGKPPVFSGIKAAVHAADPRKSAFKKLLELGGAEVLHKALPPFSNLKEATHIIAEPHKLPKVSVDYESLAIHGIAVVAPMYINEYLVADQDAKPKVEDHLVDQFKPHWERKTAAAANDKR